MFQCVNDKNNALILTWTSKEMYLKYDVKQELFVTCNVYGVQNTAVDLQNTDCSVSIQVNWMKCGGFGGWMVWSLDITLMCDLNKSYFLKDAIYNKHKNTRVSV